MLVAITRSILIMIAQQPGLCPPQSRPAGRQWLLATHVGTHSEAPVDVLCIVFMPGLQVFPGRRGNRGGIQKRGRAFMF